MTCEIRQSFVKDASQLPPQVKNNIAGLILKIEKAKTISELSSCKKLTGFKTAYRIRLGHYRIGFFYEKNTVELVRILDRKNIYRFFP